MQDKNGKIFIRFAREGEFASIEGWYEPVQSGRRRFSQDEVDELRRTDASKIRMLSETINRLQTDLDQSNEALRKIETIVNPF